MPSLLAVAALVAVGVGVPMVLGALSGALFIPRNDDPAYRRIALDLYATGRLELNGWSQMTLIGQILFVQPFLWLSGGAAWAFTASTAVLAATGIVAGYSLVRRVLSVPRATLAVLGVLLFPGFLLNTTSFMTDVPAWSAAVTCLSLGAVALDRQGYHRWLWLYASLAVGCYGFSIREFGIAAPVAVLVACAIHPRGGLRSYLVAGATTLAVCGAIYVFVAHLPGEHQKLLIVSDFSLIALRQGVATLALVLSPALVVAIGSWWRRWQVTDVLVGSAAGLLFFHGPLLALLRTGAPHQVIVGNLIGPSGSLSADVLYGPRPLLFVPPSWQVLNVAALIAGLVVCAICGGAVGAYLRSVRHGLRDGRGRQALWHWTGSTWTLLAVFVVLYGGGIGALSIVLPVFDRYLWPLALPLYAILLRPPAEVADRLAAVALPSARVTRTGPSARIRNGVAAGFAALLLTGIAATSLVLLVNADAFDAARWRMGDAATERGIAAGTVDAGFEWVAFHATGFATADKPAPSLGGIYEALWPSFHLCALVSAAPLKNATLRLEEVDAHAYRLLLFGGPWEPLYLYRVQDPSCP